MKLFSWRWLLLFVVLLASCGRGPEYRCIDGVLWIQWEPGAPWRQIDATGASPSTFTPTKCLPPSAVQ